MPTIRIDDVVMAHLNERLRFGDTYNDIVRALLGLPPTAHRSARVDVSTRGALMPLIAAGTLAEGDTVTWHRRRRGEVHTATVDDLGRMVTVDGAVFLTPNTCASALAGYPCQGWHNWRTATGESLQQLHDRTAVANTHGRPDNSTAAG